MCFVFLTLYNAVIRCNNSKDEDEASSMHAIRVRLHEHVHMHTYDIMHPS